VDRVDVIAAVSDTRRTSAEAPGAVKLMRRECPMENAWH
jgi:hypothetical protein